MPPVSSLWNVDWLNANSQRAYPISETASRMDVSGSFRLPDDLLVDLLLPIHADESIDPVLFHLKSVGVFGGVVVIALGYDGNSIGSAAIDASTFVPNSRYRLFATSPFFDTIATLVIGSLNTILQTAGSFEFDVDGGMIEPHAVVPFLRGVQALYLENDGVLSEPIVGDVVLQAGRNALLTYIPGPVGEPDRVQISAIDGAGLNSVCDCGEARVKPCIKTINGITPDDDGDFKLLGDERIELSAIANGLQLSEKCADPCCGCSELGVVLTAMQNVANAVSSMEGHAYKMEAAIQNLNSVILVSKLGQQT